MSDIKVGDLVVVVRPRRCGCAHSIGWVFKVASVAPSPRGGYCAMCGKDTFEPGTLRAYNEAADGYSELSRLKRIPPLGELEGAEVREALPDRIPTEA
jgi:hypothetical protein